ncbi:MOP flippase family protein [Acinetobacter sp. 3657]|uniref:MOP flippase family protein n=1 Tax=Acinetobacter sp. 3657 TaxID=2817764 RepID=UPI0028671F4E|nr:PST family polysaccharide transporter [Prolinoborus sp. 3657]
MTAESSSDLKKKAVKGGALTISSKLVTIVIQILSLVILSRLLLPSDFGLIAMVMAITAFMGIFRDMGLSTAVIQKKDLTYDQINMLFWLNTAVGLLLTILTVLLAPLIAGFYAREELKPVIMLLAMTFFIASVGAQHSALLQRDLNLKPKVIADIVGAVFTLIVSIVLAMLGYGFWSLAWGTVIGALATTLLYFKGSAFTPSKPKAAQGVRQLIHFGANVTLFEMLNYFHRNLDSVLIGKFWGAVAVGLYSRAYQMMMLPIASLRQPINAIAFPVLSRLQDDPIEFKKYYEKIATLLAFLSMPLMAFLVVNAQEVVEVTLGKGWEGVVPIFTLLGITGFIQAVASLRGLVLLSLGHSKRYILWGAFNAIFVSLGFVVGVQWGAEGVATAYAIVNYAILYPSLWYFFKNTPLKPRDFFTPLKLPIVASLSAALGSYVINLFINLSFPILNLIISALIYFIIFIVVVIIMPDGLKTLRDFRKLLRVIRA